MEKVWRLKGFLDGEGQMAYIIEKLSEHELSEDLGEQFAGSASVVRDGDDLFVYVGTREEAERMMSVIDKFAFRYRLQANLIIERFVPEEDRWADDMPQ